MLKALLTTAVPAIAMLPAVVHVNAPVGINVIVPPPTDIGLGAVIVTMPAVPLINTIDVVGAIVVALAIVGATSVEDIKPEYLGLVSVGVPSVGDVPNTNAPVPVSPITAEAKLAELGVAKKVATPVPKPLIPVDIGKPVQLDSVPDEGVPNTGVIKVGDVNNLVFVSCLVTPP